MYCEFYGFRDKPFTITPIVVGGIEINFVAFFVLSAFMLFGSGAAVGILVGSLLLSETISHLRRRLRGDVPRDLITVMTSIADNLAVDGLGLLAGSVVFYALGGSTPFIPPPSQWLTGLLPITQSPPAAHPGPAIQLLREHPPRNATAEHEYNASEAGAVR